MSCPTPSFNPNGWPVEKILAHSNYSGVSPIIDRFGLLFIAASANLAGPLLPSVYYLILPRPLVAHMNAEIECASGWLDGGITTIYVIRLISVISCITYIDETSVHLDQCLLDQCSDQSHPRSYRMCDQRIQYPVSDRQGIGPINHSLVGEGPHSFYRRLLITHHW